MQEDASSKTTSFSTMAWAKRLQAIAQTGLTYARDQYDVERYRAVRRIATEMIAACSTAISSAELLDIFNCEVGYATPKIDVRAAVTAPALQLSGRRERNLAMMS